MSKYSSFRIEEWEAFVKTAETGSFSAAARSLQRAQSAVSTQIANLESNLGYPLFARGRRAKLTDRGEMILEEARNLLSRSNNLAKNARELAWEAKPRLFIGLDYGVDQKEAAKLLALFKSSHPNIQVQIEGISGLKTQWYFKNTHMDLAIVYSHHSCRDLAEHILKIVPNVVVAGKNHKLSQTGSASFEELAASRQIAARTQNAFSPNPEVYSEEHWEVDSIPLALHMAEMNLGWTIVPESLLMQHPNWKNTLSVIKTPLTLPFERLSLRWKEGALNESLLSWFISSLGKVKL